MPILPQLNPRRRRPISPRILKAFNKINKAIRSTSSSSSSSSSPSSPSPSTTPHTRMSSSTSHSSAQQGFPLLAALPLELQCHVLSFLPIPTLCKTLARTNRYWNHLIDSHIRRELLVLVASGSDVERQPARIQLIFEAQRPIDTVVSKHSLFFSHFGVTNSMPGGVFSTIANFVFVPPPAPAHDEEAEYDGERDGGLSGDQPMSRASSRGPPSASTAAAAPRSLEEMAMQRGVHPSSLGRLREEHHSSSVTVARSRSHSRASEGGFTFVAAPLEHRDPQVREREMSASGDRSMESAASATGTGGTGSGTASTDLPHVLGAYDWGAPVSSLVGGGMSPSSIRSRSRARAPRIPRGSGKGLGGQQPTYKMQLDPLDSFETWILSLTVRSKKQLGPMARRGSYGGGALSPATSYDSGYSQTLRFQKRVAEGLDRVYRDWFYAPQSSSEASGVSDGSSSSSATPYQQALWQAAVTPEMVSTFGAINLAGSSGSHAAAEDDRGEGSSTAAAAASASASASTSTATAAPRKPKVWPSLRKLEIDNASCQAIIQPHPSSNPAFPTGSSTSSAFHPALQATYSHAYLGSSTAYSHLNSTHRMEMKFHVEAVEVHAGRLLTALLELEEEVGEAVREARGRRMAASARWGGASAGDGRGIVVASASGSGSSMSMAAQDPATMAAAAQFMGLTDGAWAGVGALPYGRQQRARQTEVMFGGGEGSGGGGGGGGVDAMDYDD